MSSISVEEFAGAGIPGTDNAGQQAARRLIASQVVAIGGASAATTNALNNATTLIRVAAEADCYITYSTGTPNAATATLRMVMFAGSFDYFTVPLNSGFRVACIERTVA